MEITFNTPALLFPAISLLLLAYTNRYLALANLIRKLHDEYLKGDKKPLLLKQIKILRIRINMVRQMQAMGVFSFLCCVVTMYSVYADWAIGFGCFCDEPFIAAGVTHYFPVRNIPKHQSPGMGTKRYGRTGKDEYL